MATNGMLSSLASAMQAGFAGQGSSGQPTDRPCCSTMKSNANSNRELPSTIDCQAPCPAPSSGWYAVRWTTRCQPFPTQLLDSLVATNTSRSTRPSPGFGEHAFATDPDLWARMNPYEHLDRAADVNALMVHGENDSTVSLGSNQGGFRLTSKSAGARAR